MARSRLLAASVLALALAAACTNQDADRDDVIAALEDAGVGNEQAECVADGLDEELNQEQLNDVRDASELDDIEDDELQETVQSVLQGCLGGGPSGSDTTEDTDATDDATTTTEADTGG